MKGQQISPWSIYNQQLLDFTIPDQQIDPSQLHSLNKPKIQRRISALNYNHSELISDCPHKINRKPKTHSIIETSKTQDQKNNNDETTKDQSNKEERPIVDEELIRRQGNTVKEMIEKETILRIINLELRNQENHSLIVKAQPFANKGEEERRENWGEEESQRGYPLMSRNPLKKESQIIKLPKLVSYKECIIQNIKIAEDLQPSEKEADRELVHRLLKQKIEAMISEKMKVLSKKKQLISRELPFNFEYKHL